MDHTLVLWKIQRFPQKLWPSVNSMLSPTCEWNQMTPQYNMKLHCTLEVDSTADHDGICSTFSCRKCHLYYLHKSLFHFSMSHILAFLSNLTERFAVVDRSIDVYSIIVFKLHSTSVKCANLVRWSVCTFPDNSSNNLEPIWWDFLRPTTWNFRSVSISDFLYIESHQR